MLNQSQIKRKLAQNISGQPPTNILKVPKAAKGIVQHSPWNNADRKLNRGLKHSCEQQREGQKKDSSRDTNTETQTLARWEWMWRVCFL